jgi:hypothetical protein
VDDQRRAPLELPRLRQWAGHLIESYDALQRRGEIGYSQQETRLYREALVSAVRACDGEFKRPVKARIRELLALGAASYGLAADRPAPVSFADGTVVDFAVCALWPMATLPELPSTWLGAFLDVARSTHLASLIVRARYRLGTPDEMSAGEFGQAVAQVNYAPGIRTLLADLGDPRRAGCALTGLAIAHRSYAPRRGATQKRVAQWALAAATGVMAAPVTAPVPRPRFDPAPGPLLAARY